MRILITNYTLETRTGTETFVRDLALGLLARGHEPVVYSPALGPLAEELHQATVPVVDDLAKIAEAPDLIHGQHIHETMAALLRFPLAPAVFVVHDWFSWHDTPPRMPQVRRYIAVDQTRRDRLVMEHGIPPGLVRVIPNSVDTRRFQPRPPLPERPRRALVFSSYVRHARQVSQVREACALHGIQLDVAGAGIRRGTDEPQVLLPAYDLVFGLGRSAMEAMAAGTGVIVWGLEGLGGFVSRENFQHLLDRNFGRRALRRTDTRAIAAEIAAYSPEEAGWVRDHVRETHSLDRMLQTYLAVYEDVVEEARADPASLVETLQAAGGYLAECVPKAQVDAVLGRRASRTAKRIRKLADAIPILTALALVQLDLGMLSLARNAHTWLIVGMAAISCALLGGTLYARSWLRAKSGTLAQRGWSQLYHLNPRY